MSRCSIAKSMKSKEHSWSAVSGKAAQQESWPGPICTKDALVGICICSISFCEICEPDAKVDGPRAVQEAQQWSGGGTSGRLVPLTGFYDQFGGPGTIARTGDCLKSNSDTKQPSSIITKAVPGHLARDHEGIGDIAILRLDGDWYASTKICLEYLFHKVVPGGFVIIDDYGTYDGCKRAVDEYLSSNRLSLFLNRVNRGDPLYHPLRELPQGRVSRAA